MSMQDNNGHLEMAQALAAGTDPVTGEVFPVDSPSNQRKIIRALFFAINELEALAQKGNQGLTCSEEEDALLVECFGDNLFILIPANRLDTRWNSGDYVFKNIIIKNDNPTAPNIEIKYSNITATLDTNTISSGLSLSYNNLILFPIV